jgi:DNA-binding NtrC family response regulator
VNAILVGESPAIRQLRGTIERLAPTGIPVLVHGETGSGKEIVARLLHARSTRRGAHVSVNCGAVGDAMFESAMFGHVRGAFTGAISDHDGYLAEANGGTLFLDEVGSMPSGCQAKLLRAIELREFRPVGSRRDRISNFRVVAACNEDLATMLGTGRFRHDLLQRLSGARLQLPPLRHRREDIPLLARYFLRQTALGGCERGITPDAMQLLLAHDWPGNVRELRQVLETSLALSDTAMLDSGTVRPHLDSGWLQQPVPSRAKSQQVRLLAALEETCGDAAAAADLLGVHRATVYRRLQRLRGVGRSEHSDAIVANGG